MVKATAFSGNGACDMMSYEEFTKKEAVLENAPRAEREKFYADILEKETGKTDQKIYLGLQDYLKKLRHQYLVQAAISFYRFHPSTSQHDQALRHLSPDQAS